MRYLSNISKQDENRSSIFVILHIQYRSCKICFLERPTIIEEPKNPCIPSPCGPYSDCRVKGNRPVCSCLPNYFGSPPNCRPECIINSECALVKACINQRCRNPCPGSCGANAQCKVINHVPVCFCLSGYSGDPFTGCHECKTLMAKSFNYKSICFLSSFSLLQLLFLKNLNILAIHLHAELTLSAKN